MPVVSNVLRVNRSLRWLFVFFFIVCVFLRPRHRLVRGRLGTRSALAHLAIRVFRADTTASGSLFPVVVEAFYPVSSLEESPVSFEIVLSTVGLRCKSYDESSVRANFCVFDWFSTIKSTEQHLKSQTSTTLRLLDYAALLTRRGTCCPTASVCP